MNVLLASHTVLAAANVPLPDPVSALGLQGNVWATIILPTVIGAVATWNVLFGRNAKAKWKAAVALLCMTIIWFPTFWKGVIGSGLSSATHHPVSAPVLNAAPVLPGQISVVQSDGVSHVLVGPSPGLPKVYIL